MRARADSGFAEKIRQLIILCSSIADGNSRFDDPRWSDYRRQCQEAPWARLRDRSFNEGWASPSDMHPDIEAALDLEPGDQAARELVANVLASGTFRLDLMNAATLYFDHDQIQALAGPDAIRGVGSSGMDDAAFRVEAAMYIACRFSSQSCDWNSGTVLVECAATAGCFPGMTMPQIFALRNSPLQMDLLERLAEHVAQMRP